jgi:hypothetical protein
MTEQSQDQPIHGQPPAQLPTAPTPSVSAVAIKIPPFWPADPLVWFAQVEAQFATRNVTSSRTRFEYVVASLSNEFATEVRDVILNPPAEDTYDILKQRLIQRTAASEQRRLQMLFTAEELGDRKPTQLLRRMQQLLGDSAGPNPDSSFLRELFLQRLPGQVRMVLASSTDMSLDALAEMADKIMEVASPTVSSVNVAPLTSEVDQLRAEVGRLRELISSFQMAPAHQSRPQSRSRSRSRQNSPHRSSTEDAYCWYHRRFGELAKKCSSPCSWSGNAQAKC